MPEETEHVKIESSGCLIDKSVAQWRQQGCKLSENANHVNAAFSNSTLRPRTRIP